MGGFRQLNTLHSYIRDDTTHYLNCPMMLGIISQASGLDHIPTLQQLTFESDTNDLTGSLACATSYHMYHALKFGKLPIIQQVTETGMFGIVRAFAFSSAQAFLNEYDIKSNGTILCCGFSGLERDSSQLGSFASSTDHATFNHHSQDTDSPDI